MTQLPTYNAILDHAYDDLHRARGALSDARDWIASDWKDGSNPTDREPYQARQRARALIAEAKGLIDQAKTELRAARNDAGGV